MFEIIVNGNKSVSEKDMKLLPYLRDVLNIYSAKDGCSEGACGTCTVIIDGKATRACIPALSKVVGKNIVTIEGLSEREKAVYGFAFADTGAVQCGFCIPGMVMSSKALIDVNNDPSPADVKKAIRANICRCTGYVKIEEAILLAAKMLRENTAIPERTFTGKLGDDYHRVDAIEKTLATGVYVDDVVVPDMIFGKALRTKYPRAKVVSMDLEEAKKHPDCLGILTAADVPGDIKIGHLNKDWDALIAVGMETRYVGDSVALVASKNQGTLDEILKLIKVEYEELVPLTSPEEALKEGAPKIHEGGNLLKHEKLKRGDAVF